MKTIQELNKIIPTIIDLVESNNHDIGEAHLEEDGWSSDYSTNHVCYDEEGWFIEVTYQCCGEYVTDFGDYWTPPSSYLKRAWGEVLEIEAYHYDDETGEETEFSDEDLKDLYSQIDEALKEIA